MSMASITIPSLADPEIRELIKKAQEGDLTAREEIFLAHIPLAISRAQKYEGFGVPYDDLYQEACYGILIAVEHYDLQKPESFGTFATHYVEKFIRDNALTKQNYTIPSCYNRDFYYELKAFVSVVKEYEAQTGRGPSDRDISDLMNISMFRVKRLRQASRIFLAPSMDLDDISPANVSSLPYHRPVEEEVLQKIGDPLMVIEESPGLSSRERDILERRCGFNESGKPETWPAICAATGLSRETVRQIFLRAIAKYRKALQLPPEG